MKSTVKEFDRTLGEIPVIMIRTTQIRCKENTFAGRIDLKYFCYRGVILEDVSQENLILMRRRQDLVEAFYRVYDPSRLWQEWDQATRKGTRDLNGEGRHFKSYKIPMGSSRGLDLAMNVAKPSFHMGRTDMTRDWVKACKAVKSLSHPLLPPFEVLEGAGDLILFVMPFCEEALSLSQQNSPKISAQIASLRNLLLNHGYIMDDYWQLRTCRGYPFVIDFSELKRGPSQDGLRLR